ncbi:MAG: hypothetical protein B6244_04355 [Candidatus Cloacimonetes bacterium 4572_55]|nr:MAG: hypothetical protein B6244_04355 [Candidatus Cloacimonetes bacterium 4572_55]
MSKIYRLPALLLLPIVLFWVAVGCSPPPPPPSENIKTEFEVAEEGTYMMKAFHEKEYTHTQENIKKGLGFLQIGLLDEAEEEFRKAVTFDPKFVAAHINLGRVYLGKEMYHHALDSFETAIRLNPQISKTHYYRGIAFEKLGQIEEAIESLRHALEFDSNLTEASDMLQRLLGVTMEENMPNLGELYLVSIDSEPEGATVTLNNEFKGTTPMTLNMDLVTMDQLRVTKDGYVIDYQDLKFSEGTKQSELTVIFTKEGRRSSTVMTNSRGVRLVVDPIQFDANSTMIKPSSYPSLNRAGQALIKFPNYQAVIEGHTDNAGDTNHNQKLSKERSQSVADYLSRSFGINPSRFRVVGYGESHPIADNNSDSGRAINRRIEIVVLTNSH